MNRRIARKVIKNRSRLRYTAAQVRRACAVLGLKYLGPWPPRPLDRPPRDAWVSEFQQFPTSPHDDQVDAMSYAVRGLMDPRGRERMWPHIDGFGAACDRTIITPGTSPEDAARIGRLYGGVTIIEHGDDRPSSVTCPTCLGRGRIRRPLSRTAGARPFMVSQVCDFCDGLGTVPGEVGEP